jgi:hypothetical protein
MPKSALERTFGKDAEAYLAEQSEPFEKAKDRWATATSEEWAAGANGIFLPSFRILPSAS